MKENRKLIVQDIATSYELEPGRDSYRVVVTFTVDGLEFHFADLPELEEESKKQIINIIEAQLKLIAKRNR